MIYFLLWTFCLYWIHVLSHLIKNKSHAHHHRNFDENAIPSKWSWKNFFIWVDDWQSTKDQWITEVIPTFIFSLFTGQWWILGLYWAWSAFVQEIIEHNNKINLYPFLTSGVWHCYHHKDDKCNYGLFFPLWDIIFRTNHGVARTKPEAKTN